MNEVEKLEAELRELKPLPPGDAFKSRLESALGDAGKVAMRCLPEEHAEIDRPAFSLRQTSESRFPRPILFGGLAGLGLAALWAVILYVSSSIAPDARNENGIEDDLLVFQKSPPAAVLIAEDPDSPLHGRSLEQIQDVSVMPVSGWMDPQSSERLLRMVDEGVIDRPGFLPARRVRHYFMDETLWRHSDSDLRILSTNPREEVFLIESDTY